jgi:hypothetical protein
MSARFVCPSCGVELLGAESIAAHSVTCRGSSSKTAVPSAAPKRHPTTALGASHDVAPPIVDIIFDGLKHFVLTAVEWVTSVVRPRSVRSSSDESRAKGG